MINNNGIKIIAENDLMPSERAISQLEEIARDERVKKPVLGLVDIHDKKENDYPTGMVTVSNNHIFPQLMLSGPNCGMRMITTPISQDMFSEKDIDNLFRRLSEKIYINPLLGERLSKREIIDVIKTGASWVENKYHNTDADVKNIESQGNAFRGIDIDEKTIREALPKSIIDISRYRMGIMGTGNHFFELQVVEEVFDERAANLFSVKEGNFCFLMHSGSGGFGAMVNHLYSPRTFSSRDKKMHTFVIVEWLKSFFNNKRRKYLIEMFRHSINKENHLFGLEEGTDLADILLTSIRAAHNFGYANRAFIAMKIKEVISQQYGIKQEALKTLYDVSHMSINKEVHDNEYLWVHRTGAVRALSAAALPEDSSFKQTGTPIFLPGSMGDATYICVSTDNNSRTYFSAGHGAGRLPEDRIGRRSMNRNELVAYLEDNSVKLYRGNTKRIIKQDPRCFKDIHGTVEYLEECKLARKVARLKPVAVLKG